MKFLKPYKPSIKDRLNAENKTAIPLSFTFKHLIMFGIGFFALGIATSLMILI